MDKTESCQTPFLTPNSPGSTLSTLNLDKAFILSTCAAEEWDCLERKLSKLSKFLDQELKGDLKWHRLITQSHGQNYLLISYGGRHGTKRMEQIVHGAASSRLKAS